MNVGLLGHVDHGKTTLTEALTGKWTDVHSEEIKRGITIRLGYADATFYRCSKCGTYLTSEKCPKCFLKAKLSRTVSFVDAPGHESLMAIVLSGSALMNGVLFLIAANEKCPMPQTREHMMVLEIVGIKNVIIVQNKIDLVSEERVKKSYEEIKKFIKGTVAEEAPIIPISAQQRVNIEYVIQAMEERIPTMKVDPKKDPKMFVARSFDVNKPGTNPKKLVGGVLGGSVVEGELKVGDDIEIRPGVRVKGDWKPLTTKVNSLQKAGTEIKKAGPGGLLGLMTSLDPFFTKADGLVGNVVGLPGKMPPSRSKIKLKITLLKRMVGTKEIEKVKHITKNETLMINVGTARSVGTVEKIKGNEIEMELKIPVCADLKDRVVLSRQIMGRWRLIGYGSISG